MANCDDELFDDLYAHYCDEPQEVCFKVEGDKKEHKTRRFSGSEESFEYLAIVMALFRGMQSFEN